MGATFPVGAVMAPSHPTISSIERAGDEVVLHFWADSERTYSLLQSDAISGSAWTKVADVFPTPLPRQVALTNSTTSGGSRFYRLISPRQP